ncbi:MAG: hypothetical protein AAF436_17760 [Myxococcota bacterium]
MLRKDIVVAFLALAVGALGCGDDSSGTGATGGSGGSGGSGGGGLPTACTDEPDLSAATSAEFPAQFWACYDTADMDVVLSVDSCVQDTPGLSEGCAGCYGDYAGCVDSNCGDSCNSRGADVMPCGECVLAECNVDLTSCSGVGSPAVQPQLVE